MFKKIGFKTKLIALFLLVGLIPLVVIGLLSYNNAKNEIREEVFKQLEMYSDISKDAMNTYFEDIFYDAQVMATTRDIYQSLNFLAEAGYDTGDPAWRERIKIIDTLMAALAEDKGYDLLYLTDQKGVVIYSTNQGFMGDDVSNRNYIQDALQGRTEWSQLFFSDVTNTNVMTVGTPVLSGGRSGNILGTLNIVVDDQGIAQILHGSLGELGQTADAFLVNADGLLFSNARLGEFAQGAALKRTINTRAVEVLAPEIRAGNTDFYAAAEYRDHQGDPVLEGLEVVQMGRQPMGLVVKIDQAEAFAGVTRLRNVLIPLIAVSAIIIAAVAFVVALTVVNPVQKVSELTMKLAAGDFTVKAAVAGRDEIGQMAQNINNTVEALHKTLQRVQAVAENVSHASDEISAGNQDLSQRTQEQASSLEEIASTVEEIASSIEAASVNAAEADNLSQEAMQTVLSGEKTVKDMQGAMVEITSGSQEIAEIIGSVNDIAFQTNLLALNAAVEAARAGEQGRGFAVVAAEVRNLAGRAAESAKEIEKRIKDSIARVENGNVLMNETENVLQEIMTGGKKTSDVVGEIAAALQQLAAGVKDIREAIEELNQVTQQNASLVEEIASSSENMHSEALELTEQVGFFKLSTSNGRVNGNGNGTPVMKRQTDNGKNDLTKKAFLPQKAVAVTKVPEFEFDAEDFEKF